MSNKYSYSKLGVYKSCPFKYKLQYEDGHYVFSDSIATEFGTAIHETEELIAHALKDGTKIEYNKIKTDLILKFAALEHKYSDEYLLDDNKSGRTYRDKAYQYLESGIYNLEKFMQEHPNYQIVGIEQKFNFEYDSDHIFNGAIDRVFYDTTTGRYLIQDIKSWAVPAKPDELTTPLQFVVYVLAAKNLWGVSPEQVSCQYYLPLVENGLTQDGGTNGYMTRGIKKIESLFSSIAAQDFKPNPSALCNYCNFCRTNPTAPEEAKYLCPYYSLWERTTRNKYDITRVENKWEDLDHHQMILEAYHKKYNVPENYSLN